MIIEGFGCRRERPVCDFALSKWLRGDDVLESIIGPLVRGHRVYQIKRCRNGMVAVFIPTRDAEGLDPSAKPRMHPERPLKK